MKQIFTLLMLMMFAISLNAQYIYNDFDANQNETFAGWPNNPAAIANPDASGINTSGNVAEWVRSEEQWAHVYCDIDGTIDFTNTQIFDLKVYLPIACEVLFKLESSSGTSTEVMANVQDVNQWVQLNFDFSGAQSGFYNKIVIFFDFATTTDNTFYFDDVVGPEYGSGGTGDPVDLPVTFEDENVYYGFTDFGGFLSDIVVVPTDPSNMVAQSIKTEGAETWAGTTVGGSVGFVNPIPFTATATTMSVAVWSPTANTPIRLKVELAGDPTISVETETNTTVAAGWEIMLFDFSNEAPGTAEINLGYTYNKASIFFNFGATGATAGEQTYYWDDMVFGIPTAINEQMLEVTKVYPNPATNLLHLDQSLNLSQITIYALTGQMVYQSNLAVSIVDVSALPVGLYSIRTIDVDGITYSAKFIKE